MHQRWPFGPRGRNGVPVLPNPASLESLTVTDATSSTLSAALAVTILETLSVSDAETGVVPVADNWSTRIAGTVMADRLDGVLPVTTNTSTVGAFVLNETTSDHVTRDTTLKAGTASASRKFAVLNSDGSASGQVGINFSSVRTFGNGSVVWGSYRIRAPASQVYQPWLNTGGSASGHKLSIISHHTGSNQANECVVQSNYNAGLIQGYHQDGSSFPPEATNTTTNCPIPGSSDIKWQNSIDRGVNQLTGNDPETGTSWSSCAQDRARYGGLYSASQLSQYKTGFGDPLTGGFRQYPDEWITVTFRVAVGAFGSANSRWTLWAERENVTGYTKVFDATGITLGSGPAYDTLWLQPYTTSRIAGGVQVTGRTNNITGCTILVCGLGTTLGTGTLSYNATTHLFTWAGAGETASTARGFSEANGITTINVASTTTNSYVTIKVVPASLPSSGTTTDTVTVATGRPDTQVNYQDAIISTLPIISPRGAMPSGFTKLADAAAAMSAGTWVEITGTNQDAILGNWWSFSMANDITRVPWNPISKRIEVLGCAHAAQNNGSASHGVTWPSGFVAQSYAAFDDSTGVWTLRSADDGVASPPESSPRHGFAHTQVDPITGDIYHYKALGGSSVYNLWKCVNGSTAFSALPSPPSSGYTQYAVSSCWWTGAFTGRTFGSHGAFMLFNSGPCGTGWGAYNGEIMLYDPTVGFLSTMLQVVDSTYNSGEATVMAYSAIHNCALYGGGDSGNSLKAYRLNSDGTHTLMPPVPGVGMGDGYGEIVCDPITGFFLLLTGGNMYVLDPRGAGSWSAAVTGGRVPPAGVNDPDANGVFVVDIPDYGVIAAISQRSATGGTFYIYKHA